MNHARNQEINLITVDFGESPQRTVWYVICLCYHLTVKNNRESNEN